MNFIGDFATALEFSKEPHSSLEVVKDTIPIALNAACLGKIKNAIATVLNANLQIHSSHLQGIPVAYDRQNVKMLSGNGDILSDQSCVHFTVKTSYVVFKPKIGDVIKGMVNKKGSLMIGCLVHEFFYCSVSCTQAQSDSCKFGDDVFFKVEKLEEDGHGMLSTIGSFIKVIPASLETDSGIDEKESTCHIKSPENDMYHGENSGPDTQQTVVDSVLATPDAVQETESKKKEKKAKKKKKKSKKHDEDKETGMESADESTRKKKKKHKKEKKKSKKQEEESESQQKLPANSELSAWLGSSTDDKQDASKAVVAMAADETATSFANCLVETVTRETTKAITNTLTNIAAEKSTDIVPTKGDAAKEAKTIKSPKKKQKLVVTNSLISSSKSSDETEATSIPSPKKKHPGAHFQEPDGASSIDEAIESVVRQAAQLGDVSQPNANAEASSGSSKPPKKASKRSGEDSDAAKDIQQKTKPPSNKKASSTNENGQSEASSSAKPSMPSTVDRAIESVVRRAAGGRGVEHASQQDAQGDLPPLSTKNAKKKAKAAAQERDLSDTGSCDMFKTDLEANSGAQPSKPKKGKKRKLHDASGDQLSGSEKVAKLDDAAPLGGSSADMAKYYLAQMGLTLNADGSTSKSDGVKTKKAKKKSKSKG